MREERDPARNDGDCDYSCDWLCHWRAGGLIDLDRDRQRFRAAAIAGAAHRAAPR